MDLWFDPSRQVIIDKYNWRNPYIYVWVRPENWQWTPTNGWTYVV